MSRTKYERQARALQNEITRLDAEVAEARKKSHVAAAEFAKVTAETLRRDRNWLLFVLLNGSRDARDRFLSLRDRARTRSSEVANLERDLRSTDNKLDELVVGGLRQYDSKYRTVEEELNAIRQARIACERTLGAVASARTAAAQAARTAPPRSRKAADPEVELAGARVSAAVQVVRDGVDEVNSRTRSSSAIRSALSFAVKSEFSGVRTDRSKRVFEFTSVGNGLKALEKDLRQLRTKIDERVTTLQADLRRRQEAERERVRIDSARAH